jgi:hypothetical protein
MQYELSPHVIEVVPQDDFTLLLTFKNGETRLLDMTAYFHRSEFFDELQNWNYFRQVKVDHGTVVWPNGQDLCTDTLYLTGIPQKTAKRGLQYA